MISYLREIPFRFFTFQSFAFERLELSLFVHFLLLFSLLLSLQRVIVRRLLITLSKLSIIVDDHVCILILSPVLSLDFLLTDFNTQCAFIFYFVRDENPRCEIVERRKSDRKNNCVIRIKIHYDSRENERFNNCISSPVVFLFVRLPLLPFF